MFHISGKIHLFWNILGIVFRGLFSKYKIFHTKFYPEIIVIDCVLGMLND